MLVQLLLPADTNLGAAPGSAVADQLTLSGGTLQTTSSFTLSTNRGITLSTGGGTINTDASTTLTYGGVIDGTTAFTKSGDGILNVIRNKYIHRHNHYFRWTT